ncbi:MAG TPA: MarR family transcriptional regulator [Rhizobiales bacterium]|nr:MarR family transcriptional regulator [Hyphomicrobiales bacterium]
MSVLSNEPAATVADASVSASGRAASKTRLRLWLRILKTSRLIESEVREKLRQEFDSTLPRFDVMAALYRAEAGLRMSDLSSELRVSNGNVTGIVDRLVSDGLIVRVPVDNDRRAMIVRLTNSGRELFQRMAAKHESWVNEILGGLSAAEATRLMATLEAAVRRLEGKESE